MLIFDTLTFLETSQFYTSDRRYCIKHEICTLYFGILTALKSLTDYYTDSVGLKKMKLNLSQITIMRCRLSFADDANVLNQAYHS